jgi:hypothetical protein
MGSRLIRVKTDDRYAGALFVETQRKPKREEAVGAKVKSEGDSQPIYKMKPRTGELRGKKR